MLNSLYFQPMQHKALTDIRKYALLSDRGAKYYAVVKPEGIDVYINKGKLYDLNHNELQNQYLKFHFEKLLKVSVDMQMTIMGTITSPNILQLLKHRSTLFTESRSPFVDLTFVGYDTIFPVFDAEHVYQWRYSIVEKVVAVLPHCKVATKTEIKDEVELRRFVLEVFTIDVNATILVYRMDKKFVPGASQLLFEEDDVASYKIEANQRYRAHVKSITSTTIRMDNGDKYDVALCVIGKYKKDFVEVLIDQTNLAFRKYIWDNRKLLKGKPFWFTGYTLLENRDDLSEYVTLINKFLSFIPDANGNFD